jgi:hypothetical protein
MNMRDYPIVHLDINQSKGTVLLFLFYISVIDWGSSIMNIAHPKNERDSAPSLYLSDTRGRAGTIVGFTTTRAISDCQLWVPIPHMVRCTQYNIIW